MPKRSRDSSIAGGLRLFSHSLISVDAVFLRFPGEKFVRVGKGISSSLLRDREDLMRRGVGSVELQAKISGLGPRLSKSHVPHARSRASPDR